jgi:uncharacterized protein (TIGR02265 family)
MLDPPLIFAPAFESLLRVWGSRRAEARAAFEPLGVNIDKLDPAYPLAHWAAVLDVSARTLFPELDDDEALAKVGRGVVSSYAQTAIGGALFSVLKLMGPTRALYRLSRNLRSTNNFSEAAVIELAPKSYEVTLNLVALPHFERGVLEEGLELAGATGVEVSVLAEGVGATYDVRWT